MGPRRRNVPVGAEGLAREPWNYTCEQILKRYYTGVEIAKLR